jgi:serine/threonine-protein kinase
LTEITSRLSTALADRYRIERHLGEGGMATVYLAEDLKHKRKVAVKVLRPELAAVLGAERFVQEITTTANLQHPHILPLFDSGETDSFLYYVMPFIEGETLRDKLNRETQLGIEEAVGITTAVADALDYAHRHNVIHRDIKPENILLPEGRPMVADFGIALAVSAAAGGRMTETGLSLGTPHYMSPEQATAEKDITHRSDIYSLGSVLFEMLTGEPPHTGGSAQAIIMKIVTDDARPVTELRKSVPPHVAAATAKALEKLAADRFESAAKFAEALTNPAFTIPATHPTRVPAAVSPLRRMVPLWQHIGLAAVALAAILWAVLGRTGSGEESGATAATILMLDPGVEELFRSAHVVVSPDGGMFAIAARDSSDSPLYVRAVDEPDFHPLPGTEGALFPTFSPDGAWIAYRDSDAGRLMKVAVTGGRPITLFTNADIAPWRPHWGRDGMIVFNSLQGMFTVPGTGGVPEQRRREPSLWPHLLPDGSGVLHSAYGSQTVDLFDFATDSSRVLVEEARNPRYLNSGHILFVHPRGGLFVVPFDLASRQVTGERIPVLDDVVGGDYDISATGTLVFRSGAPGTVDEELVRVYFDGRLDTLRLAPRPLGGVRISPDGRRLAFSDDSDMSSQQLFLFDFELGGPTQVTFMDDNFLPVWSPDGTRIAFARVRDGSLNIYVTAADGNGTAELLLAREGLQWPLAWTEDGTIALQERGKLSDPGDLWIMKVEGGAEPRPYLATEWSEEDLAVSPNGRWAAYTSDETGAPVVYIRAFPTGEGQRRVSAGVGIYPRWSPDGRSVFYVRDAADVDTIYAARVELEPTFLVRAIEPVYTVAGIGRFDVHPDGTHLIVEVARSRATAADEPDRPSRVVVILNWFEELKAKVGN